MAYSVKIGLWKTFKNAVILLGPSILAFMTDLPVDVQTKWAPLISVVAYFVKNWYENRE